MLFLLPTRGGIRGSGATGTRRTSLHAVKNSSSVTVEVQLEKLISCHWSRLMSTNFRSSRDSLCLCVFRRDRCFSFSRFEAGNTRTFLKVLNCLYLPAECRVHTELSDLVSAWLCNCILAEAAQFVCAASLHLQLCWAVSPGKGPH